MWYKCLNLEVCELVNIGISVICIKGIKCWWYVIVEVFDISLSGLLQYGHFKGWSKPLCSRHDLDGMEIHVSLKCILGMVLTVDSTQQPEPGSSMACKYIYPIVLCIQQILLLQIVNHRKLSFSIPHQDSNLFQPTIAWDVLPLVERIVIIMCRKQ